MEGSKLAVAVDEQPAKNTLVVSANEEEQQESGRAFPTMQEGPFPHVSTTVADYGGIVNPTTRGIRSSSRIKVQPKADATQMDRAAALALRKTDLLHSGCQQGYLLDHFVVFPVAFGPAIPHGGWMQPSYGGGSSYFVPRWVAT